ncbi:NAD-dependent succinate-semialdehyde dehydrogenase [Corynebacterium sp. zg-331]|uniref:NAD-dependent succinate-semialdehyde dehydrogenase n=1 Tax=unclassified Corynebacterium TaxID=2624378 RepID=UPI00128D3561|nr:MULTISPECIES: NAD-dependent succinate-semialdehyde dehydrogenase [unclassified Corynebacterium]MBC3186106.1 NAD-dependent succinate-semialdehyde dehydrogenase [Corynebacterium sp. zg-331]MPV52596.1 aldehyde dehydrogenase family protein [Corynebacterium sp. zg331]
MSFDYTPHQDLLDSLPTGLWLGARTTQAASGATFEVIDPATEEVLAEVADADSRDWFEALALADAAQGPWAKVAPRQRSVILTEIFQEMTRRAEDFARVMTLEMGKPLAEARGEVAYGAEYLRWFAEEAVRISGRYAASPAGNGSMTISHTPVGPVLAITPWNFPLAMATRKIAPALAAGCPVIVKPAAETPLTMLLLGEVIAGVFRRHEVPEGVVSIVPTTVSARMSEELMADSRLRKVTFTGSTAVGKILVRQSAQHLQRTSMELGGNAPFLVAHDADLDMALDCAMQAKMRNGGEACIAANRFLVHESLAEEFTARLTERMAAIRMGHGLEESTTLGPVITARQRDAVAALVERAVEQGAVVHTGGQVSEGKGFFYPATVLSHLPDDAEILSQEIFGPVATVSTFATLEEGVARANSTEFGLAAYAFTENVHTADYLAHALEAGMVGINRAAISDAAAPFGGIKQSGFGREGGAEGIEEYISVRYIAKP